MEGHRKVKSGIIKKRKKCLSISQKDLTAYGSPFLRPSFTRLIRQPFHTYSTFFRRLKDADLLGK